MTEKFRFTRRRLLGSVLSVGAATAGAGAGTMALFGDSETSSGNAISMGTLDLELSANGDRTDSADGMLNVPSNAHPGSEMEGDVYLHSTGSLLTDDTPQVVDIDFDVTTRDPDRPDDEGDAMDGAEKMAEQFKVVRLEYDPNRDEVAHTFESDIGSEVFLDDFTGDVPALTGLTPPRSTRGDPTEPSFYLKLEWADDADYDFTYSNDAYQGDEMDITITFTLRQVTN